MAYTAKAIANAVIERARERNINDINPMKLQKLIFFAQSWHLRLINQILFDDPIERWKYGPVVRDVYHEFKMFSYHPIRTYATDALGFTPTVRPEDDFTWDFLNRILDVYGSYSATELSEMTHKPDTAWSMGELNTIITIEELARGAL